jgi:tyrosyl-tRNA synthetase
MENVIDVLEARGLIEATTGTELREQAKNPIKVYCGFDPTADSLHVGNMVAIMGLAWFQRFGHKPYVLLGGATGMIGDPSGKTTARSMIDEETLRKNVAGIANNFHSILCKNPSLQMPAFLNNYDWFKEFSFIRFLREVGVHFRMGVMLGKESVRARLESEEGLSYTEFSYQLLQGYDFLHLYRDHGVTVQIGGSDQWGNITAGIDLVRKLTGSHVNGLTLPLLVKSDGTKFGKSEKGAIWLSPEKLSPYEFYQYLFRVEDADCIRLLRMLTFIEMGEIKELERSMTRSDYVPNTAQKVLAQHVTELVHGQEGLVKALKATEAALPGKVVELQGEQLRSLMQDIPSKKVAKHDVHEKKLIDVVTACGFLPSKGETRRLIQNGGLYLNNRKIEDAEYHILSSDYIEGHFLLFAFGKKNKAILELI